MTRQLCQRDLFFLLVYVLRRPDANNDWVFDRCREVQAEPNGCIDLWFRGGFKSSILTFALTIQDLLNDPELTFGIFSFSRPIAKQFLRQIKQEFEQNEVLKGLFPDILWSKPHSEAPKWSEDDGIVLKRKGNPKESTIEAWGLVDGQPTSKHFRRRIYDDVVTDRSVTTSEQIAKTTSAWGLSQNLGSRDVQDRVIGTRYHYFDSYAEIMKRGYKVRRYAATKDGTISGEPWIHTREELAAKQIKMQEQFSPQMMQEPRLAQDAFYKPDWWRRYVVPPAHCNVYIGCDLAETAGAGDETVFMVAAVDQGGRVHIVDVWAAQTDTLAWGEELIRMVKKHKPMAVFMPLDNIWKGCKPFLSKLFHDRRCYPNIVELSDSSDKVAKARSSQGLAANGLIYLPDPLSSPPAWLADTEEELLMFPMGQKDNRVDALSMIGRGLEVVIGGRVPVATTPKPRQDYRGQGGGWREDDDAMLA